MAWLDDQFDAAWNDGVFDSVTDEITWWIAGDKDNAVSFQADVDWDNSAGRNELSGEGMSPLDAAGTSLKRSCKLEVSCRDVDPALLMQEEDRFILPDGTELVFLREDHDDATATLFCYVNEHKTTKRSRVRP